MSRKIGLAAVMILFLPGGETAEGHEGADCNRLAPNLVAFRPTIAFPGRHNERHVRCGSYAAMARPPLKQRTEYLMFACTGVVSQC